MSEQRSNIETTSLDAACDRIAKLEKALREVIVAWDKLYSGTTPEQFPFAEDLEFGPLFRARLVYDTEWFANNAFGDTSEPSS
jgi:hypothetical protein